MGPTGGSGEEGLMPNVNRAHMELGGHGGILVWRGKPTWLLSASEWIQCLFEYSEKFCEEYDEDWWWCAYEIQYWVRLPSPMLIVLTVLVVCLPATRARD